MDITQKILILNILLYSEIMALYVIAKYVNKYNKYNNVFEILLSVFCLRVLFLSYAYFINTTGQNISLIITCIFLAPYILAGFLVKKNSYNVKGKESIAIFTLLTILFLYTFIVLMGGDSSWDGAHRHQTITFLIRDSFGYWDWKLDDWTFYFPNFIHTSNSLYFITFQSTRANLFTTIILTSILLFYLYSKVKSKIIYLFLITIFISIPAAWNQIGTTYIDLPSSILLSFGLFFFYQYLMNSEKANPLFSITIIAAGISSAYQLIPIYLLGIFVLITYIIILKRLNFNKKFIQTIMMQIVVIGLFLMPLFIRNFIEKGSFVYPYTIKLLNQVGAYDFSQNSSTLQKVILKSNGWEDKNKIDVLFLQYIKTPFQNFYEMINYFFINESVRGMFISDSIFYRSNIYDNRISGFGFLFVLFVFFFFVLFFIFDRNRFYPICLILIITSLFFLAHPISFYPRYMLTFPILFMIISPRLFTNK